MRFTPTLMVCSFILAGCSHQAVYTNLQQDKARRCIEKPESQYEQCMQEANIPFDQYARERKAYLEATD